MGLRLMYLGYFLCCQPRRGDIFVTDSIARYRKPQRGDTLSQLH